MLILTNLDRYNRFRLLREHQSTVEKRWHHVVNEKMDLLDVLLFKILVKLRPLDHAAGQHTIGLPFLIILVGGDR